MNLLSFIMLEASDAIVGTLVTFFIILSVSAIVFLIIRSILLWYWKVDIILKNQDQQITLLTPLLDQSHRKISRVNYYRYLAIGNKKEAYSSLLYIIFNDLLDPKLKAEEKNSKYNILKDRYSSMINDLGYDFPPYPF